MAEMVEEEVTAAEQARERPQSGLQSLHYGSGNQSNKKGTKGNYGKHLFSLSKQGFISPSKV